MILLDSDVCIELLRERDAALRLRYDAAESIFLPEIVVAELLFGAEYGGLPREMERTMAFIQGHEMVSLGLTGAHVYARIRSNLQRRGLKIGANDLLIAATALAHDATLVTRNTGEFSRVPGLKTEDWRA